MEELRDYFKLCKKYWMSRLFRKIKSKYTGRGSFPLMSFTSMIQKAWQMNDLTGFFLEITLMEGRNWEPLKKPIQSPATIYLRFTNALSVRRI